MRISDWSSDVCSSDLGDMAVALRSYSEAGGVHAAGTRDAARAALIDRWDAERRCDPAASRIILTHLKTEVKMLNDSARERLGAQGALGPGITVQTERGPREFAGEDRILFLRNEKSMGDQTGTLGTVERGSAERIMVRLANAERVTGDQQ